MFPISRPHDEAAADLQQAGGHPTEDTRAARYVCKNLSNPVDHIYLEGLDNVVYGHLAWAGSL